MGRNAPAYLQQLRHALLDAAISQQCRSCSARQRPNQGTCDMLLLCLPAAQLFSASKARPQNEGRGPHPVCLPDASNKPERRWFCREEARPSVFHRLTNGSDQRNDMARTKMRMDAVPTAASQDQQDFTDQQLPAATPASVAVVDRVRSLFRIYHCHDAGAGSIWRGGTLSLCPRNNPGIQFSPCKVQAGFTMWVTSTVRLPKGSPTWTQCSAGSILSPQQECVACLQMILFPSHCFWSFGCAPQKRIHFNFFKNKSLSKLVSVLLD